MKTRCLIVVVLSVLAPLIGGGPAAQDSADPPAERVPGPYSVGIEDVLEIVVWDEPELSRTVTVRPDGRVGLPLIGDVSVAGLSTDEVRDLLAQKLAVFVRDPSVTVLVQEIHSFRVFVLGEVNQQGVLEFRRPTRLLQALAAAGGLTPYSKKEATILREMSGGEKPIRVDLKPLIGGDPRGNLLLQPGDTVLVD